MNIRAFNSTEEMVEYLQQQRQHALEGLHPSQAELTWGDHWVRFADLDNHIVEFGRVASREWIAKDMLANGEPWPDVAEAVASKEAMQEQGFLYGQAHSILGHEWGTTHKAHVWPIEKRLYDMAAEVDFDYRRLDDAGRILLEIAFRQQRAHVLPKYGEQA